jgi:predicted DNA-binding transcriptional regulator AlpA
VTRPALPEPATSNVSPLSEAVITWRKKAVARALGISERALERERSAGRFPRPDLVIGRMPLWRPETIREWVERGGA